MEPEAKPPAPCALVIFGALGDLTKRLLLPALYNLRRAHLLPEDFLLIGVARSELDDDGFRGELAEALRSFASGTVEGDDAQWLLGRARYLKGDLDDPQTYADLGARLSGPEGKDNALFYLAVPPRMFAPVVEKLHAAGLTEEKAGEGGERWRRVIIEKPFGTDLASAKALNHDLLTCLGEHQIYRIDHYLGKETVQNIMVLRFGNGIFEPLWNREHIDHVQILAAETVGVEGRGKYYDTAGALRDMVPNHLCQLLALTAMEPPSSFGADHVRSEKTKVLEAVHRFKPEEVARDVVRGQYGAGTVKEKAVTAYRESPDVAPDSTTETYVALKLSIDNWRWAGVPFYLRTGKALSKRRTEIAIRFKRAPLALFRETPIEKLTHNDLVLHIQPDEGITLRFGAKVPGPVLNVNSVKMKFVYEDAFKAAPSTGYETLIYDCMIGDATLFQRADTIEAGWEIVQPILDAWAGDPAKDLPVYPAGSAGPAEAEDLLSRDRRYWREIDTSIDRPTS